MKATWILLGATLALFLSSCSRVVPYTSQLKDKYHLSENDLKQIQFYLSEDILLYRGSDDGDAVASDGTLLIKSDRQLDQIVLRSGTPGVVMEASTHRMAVSFEIGQDKFLVFGTNRNDGKYYLQAEEWVRRNGKLEYDGKTFFAAPGSGNAHLLLKIKKLRQLESSHRVVKGRKL